MIVAVLIIILVLATIYWLFMSSYSQVFGAYPYKGVTSEPVIALTFDDGPNEPYTSQIVDYLNGMNIRATFFQVGKCVERYPGVSKKMMRAGHVIGNHSLSHEFYQYCLHPRFMDEVKQNQIILRQAMGKTPGLYRSPWLLRQPWLLSTVKKQSLRPVSGVFCHPLEPWQPTAARIAKRAIKKAKPGTILIFHDGVEGRGGDRSQTVEAIKITVEELLRRNYKFVTVDELLGIPAYI